MSDLKTNSRAVGDLIVEQLKASNGNIQAFAAQTVATLATSLEALKLLGNGPEQERAFLDLVYMAVLKSRGLMDTTPAGVTKQ